MVFYTNIQSRCCNIGKNLLVDSIMDYPCDNLLNCSIVAFKML